MKKSLILANSAVGLYEFRNELVKKLLAEGLEVVISLPDDLKDKEFKEEGCRVVHTDIDRRGVNPKRDLSLVKAYKSLIGNEKPDIVLTYTIKPNIYGGYACKKLKVPFVSTVTGLGSTFERGGLLLKVIVFMYRFALKNCECLFFQNAENRGIFEKNGIKAKRHVTVNGSGVNLEKHSFEEYPGHKDDVTRFLYVGRIMKEKGMDEYLSAAKLLHDKYGDKVSFAGIGYFDDDYEDRIKDAEKQGFFKMIPFAMNIHPYIKEADAIVNPSYHEGMSNVLMEASSTGRPCLASNISGCKEIIEDKKTGLLFESRSTESLVDALNAFMQLSMDERREMGKKAREYVEENFDRHKITEKYMQEIRRIIGLTDVV